MPGDPAVLFSQRNTPDIAGVPGPATIEPDTLPATLHAHTHLLTGAWFALAALSAAILHVLPKATLWLWMNPVSVIALLFALSVATMNTLPRLARWPVRLVALATALQSIALGAAAEAVFGRYANAPATPVFAAASVQLVVLAALGSRGALGASTHALRIFVAALVAGVLTAAPFAFAPSHRALWIAVPAATAFTAALVAIDHPRARALARIADDRHDRSAVIRAAALLVFDVVYLPVLLPRQLVRRR